MQTGFLGCFGSEVDAIEYYKAEIEKIEKEVSCSIFVYIIIGPFGIGHVFLIRFISFYEHGFAQLILFCRISILSKNALHMHTL